MGNDETTRRWQRELRRFHLTVARPEDGDASGAPLLPVLLRAMRHEVSAPLADETVTALYLRQLESHRAPLRESFAERIANLERELEELLQIDRARSGETAEAGALSGSLGAGGSFLDLDRLSGQLRRRPDFSPLDDARRQQILQVLSAFREFRDEADRRPRAIVLHAPDETPELEPGVEASAHDDPLREALGRYRRLTAELLPTLRATHLARLLIDGTFEHELHDALLEQLDWRSFTAEELQLLPQIVVIESARRVRGTVLGSLSELLRSGYPIHVLVTDRFGTEARDERREALSGNHVSLGSIAMAHREAFVLQSSWGAAEHLGDGLTALVASSRPALAVIGLPDPESPATAADQLAAMRYGRAVPCFRCDPARGAAFSERLALDGNPEPESIWPTLACDSRSERFTFAHLAALAPAYREHFAVIPPEAWNDGQLEVADYLDAPREDRRRSLPFVWVDDGEGRPARAVVTRELAFASLGRARAWRVLQELGGTDNTYARRAAEEARQSAEAAAERKIAELKSAHEEALRQAGETAVRDAMERVTASLLSFDR